MSKSLDTKRTHDRTSRSLSKPTKTRSTNSLTKEGGGKRKSNRSHKKVSKSNRTNHSKDKIASKRSKKFKHVSKTKTTKTTHEASTSENVPTSGRKLKQPSLPDDSKFDAMKEEVSNDRKQKKLNASQNVSQTKPSPSVNKPIVTNKTTNSQQPVQKVKTMEEVPADLIHAQLMDASKGSAGGAIPGENLQNAMQHGEYLLDFPTLSISIDLFELFIVVLGVTLALIGTHVESSSYMLIVNAILILLLLIALIVMQWRACHVTEELDLNNQTRYIIDPKARRYYAGIHLLRLMLVCSTFSILVYYAACGDFHLLGRTSVCEKISASKALLGVSASLFFLQLLLIIVHLVFFFKNRLSVRTPTK